MHVDPYDVCASICPIHVDRILTRRKQDCCLSIHQGDPWWPFLFKITTPKLDESAGYFLIRGRLDLRSFLGQELFLFPPTHPGYRAWKTIYSRRSTESVCPSEEVTFGALSFVFPRRPYTVDWKVHPGQQLGALWKHGKLHNVKRGSYLCWSIWFSTLSECPCGGKLSFVSTKHNPPPTAEWSTLSFCYEVLSLKFYV
jgi:hypothetical protein